MAKKLYVGSISYDTTEQKLAEVFAQAGRVESAVIITDRDTGRNKGFGFVEMSTDEEAKNAIQMLNNTTLDDRTIVVSEARERTERPNRNGGGGNRQFSGGPSRRY